MQSARSDTRTAELKYFEAMPKGIYPGMYDDKRRTVLTPGTRSVLRAADRMLTRTRDCYISRGSFPGVRLTAGWFNCSRNVDELLALVAASLR